jgi:N-acetylneuraminic acid mutarotase
VALAVCAFWQPAAASVGNYASRLTTHDSPGWTLLNPPPARSQHAAVWDPVSGRMLVFGGSGTGRLGDLWAYTPSADSWTEIVPTGAELPTLSGHTAVWDPTNSQVLVYGGYGGGPGRLWSYRPATNVWAELAPDGPTPPARGFHSAAWDPDRGQMLVFAGIGPSFDPLNDLWAYRPASNTWASLSTPAPRPFPVFYHSAVWDAASSQMVVFGGADPLTSEFLNETWAYRPASNTWVPRAPFVDRVKDKRIGLPLERLSHSATWDPVDGQMLVFGGGCGAGCYRADLWGYRPPADKWVRLQSFRGGPSARGGHSAVWDPGGGRVLIFGGAVPDGSSLRELWSYRPADGTWSRLAPLQPTPRARQQHTAVWDPVRAQMLVFGGYTGSGNFLDELLSYRPAANAWTTVTPGGPTPPARSNHAAAWDSTTGHMLVFGGYGGGGYLNDLWSYDPAGNSWAVLSPQSTAFGPAPREEASAVWDATYGQLLIFGGSRGGNEPLEDLWAYRPASSTWVELASDGPWPVSRLRHSAVWDSTRGEMLVFGGYGGGFPGGYLDDLWSYQPASSNWLQLSAPEGPEAVTVAAAETSVLRPQSSVRAQPSARSRQAAAWDAPGDRMLVFGGFAGGIDYLKDLWSYQPATDTWIELTPALGPARPTARAWHAAVWDPGNRRLLVFGGQGGGPSDEIWAYLD